MSKIPKKGGRKTVPTGKDTLTKVGLPLILLTGFLAYSNSFTCSFHFDDVLHIVENPAIRDITAAGVWWNYLPHRPVSIFTFVLNDHLFGLDVRHWHLVNLAIHLANALLVRWFTLLIFSTPAVKEKPYAKHRNMIALAAAVLFVAHPLATQSVTYIVQRMTSLAAFFYLFSLVLYFKARLTGSGTGSRLLLLAGSVVSGILAVLTKENAFTLPLTIVISEWILLQERSLYAVFRGYRGVALLAVLLGAAAFVFWKFPLRVFDPVPPESGHAVAITPLTYLFTQFSVIVKYIQLLIIPVNLHLEYDFPVAQQFTGLRTVTGFLILSSLFVLAVVFRRRERILSFGIFWFFLTLSVESGIIPIRDVLVEHRTYLPSFGFFLILATGIYRLLGDRSALAAALLWGFLAVTWSVMTYQRNRVWKDDLTLLTDNIEKAPAFARPYSNRGVIWWKQKEYEKAVADFSAAIAINPGYRDAWYNRGVVYEETGRYEEAAADYSQAVALDPEHIKAWYNRGVVHFHLGKYAEAVNDYSRAIAIDPGYADAWNNRGVAYFRLHENEKALEGFSTALKLRPDYADAWSNRGAAMFELGRYADAVADYSQAIVLRPDYKEAFVNRAIAYGNMEKWELAAADYARAMEIDPALTQLAENLAIARKKAGISTR